MGIFVLYDSSAYICTVLGWMRLAEYGVVVVICFGLLGMYVTVLLAVRLLGRFSSHTR